MAIPATTICSPPPTLSIPSLKTHQQQQCQPLHFFPSTNPSTSSVSGLVSGDAAAMAAEAVALARAAEEAAREAVRWDSFGIGREKRRKKRRRRRRKGLEYLEMEEDEDRVLFGSLKDGFLNPREEAELCLCLKEGAELEVVGETVMEAQEHPAKWLFKGRGTKRDIDKILCRRREAKERLTHSYRRLVASIATGYRGKGLSLQDLIQEGSIGLLRGAERFDPERGYKLSTYVYWWIKQAIIRAIANKSRLVRLPESMCEVAAKVAEARNILSKRLQRMPSCAEIGEELNLQVSTVRLVFDRSRSPISLNQTSDQGHMTLQDIIRGPEETMPEYMENRLQMKQEIEKHLQMLTERESHVLRLRFGLNGETPLSCEEIGRLLKLSRERVRQINGNALTKLRNIHNVADLKVYIV